MMRLGVIASLVVGLYADANSGQCTQGDALLQTKASYQPSAALNELAGSAHSLQRDSVKQCLRDLQQHKQELRQAGFDIPQNGEHIAGDDYRNNPNGVVEGGSSELEFAYLAEMAERVGEGTVCQTGLNYGTSALAFLCASSARVLSFDLGEHDYANTSHNLLNRRFHGRHRLTLGDSTETVPRAIAGGGQLAAGEKCDLVFVDGGHTEEVAKADLENFARLAAPGALVVVDDCYQAGDPEDLQGWHIQVGKAFRDSVAAGLLAGEAELSKGFDGYRSVCVGRYPSQKM